MSSGLALAAMPDRWRRPLSLSFAAVALVLAAGSGVATLYGYWERAESLEALTDDVARLKAILRQGGRAGPSPGDARDDAPDLLAPDPETATALVQSRLRALAAESGADAVQVEWTRQLPPQVGEWVTAVRASIKLKLPASHVGRVINALESDVPFLLLDEVQISPAQGFAAVERDAVNNGAMTLILTVRLYASGGRAPLPGQRQAKSRAPAAETLP